MRVTTVWYVHQGGAIFSLRYSDGVSDSKTSVTMDMFLAQQGNYRSVLSGEAHLATKP